MNVLIDISRGRENVKEAIDQFFGEQFGISAITIEELYAGLGFTREKMGEEVYAKKAAEANKLLQGYDIFDITKYILEQAGLMRGKLLAQGLTMDANDLIIGATAKECHAERIITRNPTHFGAWDIPLVIYEK
jgi:predicted nucleic acid-binding protein